MLEKKLRLVKGDAKKVHLNRGTELKALANDPKQNKKNSIIFFGQ